MWQIFDLRSDKTPETSFDRQINVFFWEIGVAEPTGHVRILTGCSEVAVFAHLQYTFDQKQLTATGAMSGGLQVAIAAFSIFY